MSITVIRPSLVYAGDAPANFYSLLRLAASGIPLPLAGATKERHFLAVENLCDFILMVLLSENQIARRSTHHTSAKHYAQFEVFTLADDESISVSHALRCLYVGMKVPQRLFRVPDWLIATGVKLLGRGEIYSQLFGPLQVSNSRAKAAYHWAPKVNVDEGFEQAAGEFIRIRMKANR